MLPNSNGMENTAKNFALQLGSLISLYVSIGALITLLFGIITTQYPDLAQISWEYESATASIRFSIAMLVVFFPTYVVLTRLVNTIRRSEHGVYLTLTKWLLYLSLLIGGGVILGDLVMVLNSFLNGELTIRFILKALSVLLVVGLAFTYYLLDARGYWQDHEKKSMQYAGMAVTFVIIALGFGFTRIQTPTEVREMNIDKTEINDLMNIQSHIEMYAQVEEKLPATLTDAFGGVAIPQAPEGRAPYTYEKQSASTFKLCASFAFDSMVSDSPYAMPMPTEKFMVKNSYTWDYKAGAWCFTRAINLTNTVKPL